MVDGARFDDASATLGRAGIPARSLFLDAGDRARNEAGPFLARLDPAALPRFLAIPDIAAACMFWLGPIEEGVLFQHLVPVLQASSSAGRTTTRRTLSSRSSSPLLRLRPAAVLERAARAGAGRPALADRAGKNFRCSRAQRSYPSPSCDAAVRLDRKGSFDMLEHDEAARPLFARTLARLGPLDLGQCYGFVPMLAFGGSAKPDRIERLDAEVHFSLLAGAGRCRVMAVQTPGENPAPLSEPGLIIGQRRKLLLDGRRAFGRAA